MTADMTDEESTSGGPRRPFRPAGGGQPAVQRPDLPEDERPELPKGVMAEIRQSATEDAEAIGMALVLGAEAIEAGRPDAALDYLPWARSRAPRAAAIREALGVARYLEEQYGEALTELRAYRRLSGRRDQNHLIADCLRALEHPPHEIADEVERMLDDEDTPADRRLEAVIVWGSSLADAGDVAGGRSVLRRADDLVHELPRSGDEVPDGLVRLWYVEGDLAERGGDEDTARRYFEQVVEAADEDYDATERLEALS